MCKRVSDPIFELLPIRIAELSNLVVVDVGVKVGVQSVWVVPNDLSILVGVESAIPLGRRSLLHLESNFSHLLTR